MPPKAAPKGAGGGPKAPAKGGPRRPTAPKSPSGEGEPTTPVTVTVEVPASVVNAATTAHTAATNAAASAAAAVAPGLARAKTAAKAAAAQASTAVDGALAPYQPTIARAKTAARVAAVVAPVVAEQAAAQAVAAAQPGLARARTQFQAGAAQAQAAAHQVATAASNAAAAGAVAVHVAVDPFTPIIRQSSSGSPTATVSIGVGRAAGAGASPTAAATAAEPKQPPKPASGPDPFHAVKEKVHKRLVKTRTEFDEWKEILNKKNTAESKEFDPLTRSISESVRLCRIDLNDLDKANTIVSTHRDTFRDIDDSELEQRKKFVQDARTFLELVEKRFSDPRTKGKIESDARKALAKPGGGRGRPGAAGGDDLHSARGGRDEDDARGSARVAGARAQIEEQEAAEDEVLDDMDAALHRLGGMAKDIQKEIKTTTTMINDLDDQVGQANQTMELVLKKLDKLLGQKDWPRLLCIGILAIIVIIMACIAFGII